MLDERTLCKLFDCAWDAYDLLRQEAEAISLAAQRAAETNGDESPHDAGEAAYMEIWNSDLGRAIRHVERMTRLAYYSHPDVKSRLMRRDEADKAITRRYIRRYPPRPLKNIHINLDED